MINLTLNWRLSLFTALLLPVLVFLGFWQLSRADEKRALVAEWQRQSAEAPVQVNSFFSAKLETYQKVRFEAALLPERYWLLEARIYQGRPGYEVFMPAVLANGERILINRGWLKADQDRRILPTVVTPAARQWLWGEVRKPVQTALVSEHDNPIEAWPHRVLEVDLRLMSKQLGQPLMPYIIALDADHPSAFVVQSIPVNMPPEKHQGYAVQWFSMSVALFLLWLFTNTNISTVFLSYYRRLTGENNNDAGQ